MNEYRVTKYDPEHRVNGAYTRAEWSSVADVGHSIGGKLLTTAEYEQMEQRHIDFLCELADICGIFLLAVNACEDYTGRAWHEGQKIHRIDLPGIVRSILREECWCRLNGENFFIHFGYDYYMYVGCGLPTEAVSALAEKYGLFCEEFRSPYHDEEEQE